MSVPPLLKLKTKLHEILIFLESFVAPGALSTLTTQHQIGLVLFQINLSNLGRILMVV